MDRGNNRKQRNENQSDRKRSQPRRKVRACGPLLACWPAAGRSPLNPAPPLGGVTHQLESSCLGKKLTKEGGLRLAKKGSW